MSQPLRATNFGRSNTREIGKLNADASPGATSLTVDNSQGFSVGDYIYLGIPGAETGEAVTVTDAPDSNTTIPVSAVKLNHSRFDPIHSLFGNKVRFYRAANVNGTAPADELFSLLWEAEIDYDQQETSYTDANGSSDYWYKFTYYNETAAQETNLSSATAVRGGGYGNYCTLEAIRKRAGFQNNRYISYADIDAKRQAAQSVIDATLAGKYVIPFTAPVPTLITECTILLAAGSLLVDNYGPMSTSSTNEGKDMIETVMNKDKTGYLDRLDSNDLELTDAQGVPQVTAVGSGVSGHPNSTTTHLPAEQGGSMRLFRINTRY